FHTAAHQAAAHGIKIGAPEIDVATLMKKKDQVVSTLVRGVSTLVSKRGAKTFHGTGRLVDSTTVEISAEGKKETIKAKNIVIATGSAPVELPFLPYDGETVVHSTHA